MWKWIRVPKGVALLAFLLPWMTVSCSDQKIAEASGFGLAFGRISAFGQASQAGNDASLNFFLILALLAIAAGLAFLFLKGREAAKLVLGTSIASIVLIFIGTWRYSKDAIAAQAAKNGSSSEMDQAALAMIQVNWEIGYWLALLSLIVAAVMAWLVMSGKEAEAEAKMRSLAADATEAAKVAATKANEAAKAATAKVDEAIDKANDKTNDKANDKKDDEPPKS